MNKNIFIASLIAASVVTGCARREEAEPETLAVETATPSSQADIEKQVPAATIAAVTVQVTLTPQAEAALKAKSEKVLLVATYSGDPKASELAQKMVEPSGMIKLGESKLTLDGAGVVTFQDDVIDKSRLEYTLGEVQMTINVTSSKSVTPENLLACTFYWETLAEASKKTVKIACKALSEAQD